MSGRLDIKRVVEERERMGTSESEWYKKERWRNKKRGRKKEGRTLRYGKVIEKREVQLQK